MIEIILAQEFEKRYAELPSLIKKKAEKRADLFRENPFHPSLHTEKLEPKHRGLWSFRIDRRHRIVFRFLNGTSALFLSIGPHDWIYRI